MDSAGKSLQEKLPESKAKQYFNLTKEGTLEDEYANLVIREKVKFPYSNYQIKKMEHGLGDGVTYKINSNQEYLYSSILRMVFPALRVKKEYKDTVEICYKYNPGNAPIIDASFLIDETPFTVMNTLVLDSLPQYYRVNNDTFFMEKMGNKDKFLEWTDKLPDLETSVIQPWFYVQESLPIFFFNLCSSRKVQLQHKYKFDLTYKSFIRMRVRSDENSDWVILKPDEINFNYLDGSLKPVEIPELYGVYQYIDRKYSMSNLHCGEVTRDKEKTFLTYCLRYYTPIIKSSSIYNWKKKKDDKPILKVGCDLGTDVKNIIFFVENITAKKEYNNTSNYTNNAEDIIEGNEVITNVSFVNDGVTILSDVPISVVDTLSNDIIPRESLVKGVHGVPYSVDQKMEYALSPSLYLKESRLTCSIKKDSNSYRLHVIYMTLNEINIDITIENEKYTDLKYTTSNLPKE